MQAESCSAVQAWTWMPSREGGGYLLVLRGRGTYVREKGSGGRG
jgi:hypothetical protein